MEFFAISGLINGIAAVSFGFLIVYKNWRDTINRVFFLLMAAVAIWSFSYWQWMSSVEYASALFWVRVLSIGSILIPPFFLHWIFLVLGKKDKESKHALAFVYFLAAIILGFSFSTLLVKDVVPKLSFQFWPVPGILYHFYLGIVYVLLVIYAIALLLKDYKIAASDKRGQIFYVVLGSVMGFGGGLTNFFLWYNIPIQPFGNFFVASFPVFYGYAMLKHKLFNAKVVATELLTFMIWVFLLIRLFTSATLQDKIIDGGILMLTIFAGVFLIRSVIKEVEHRQRLQALSEQLEKANKELARVSAAKSEFVSIVSHQLRTPLTAVKGYLSMLREGSYGALKEIQQSALKKVFQSSERLISLVNDLLNLNRIEEGRIIYNFTAVDLTLIVDEVIEDLKTLADLKKIKLSWIKPHGLSQVQADADKLRQVIINLIDNAIKYTEQGQVFVTLKMEHEQDKKECLILEVRDTGVGMDQEDQATLFKKFVRGDSGRMLYTGGTGLGLYVAGLIVEAHHGSISGASEGKGKGSVFRVRIPTKK